MDGFSAAANIITVIQAANTVISICYDFRAALKKSPWALTRVLDELSDLRSVLENLENLYNSSTPPSPSGTAKSPTSQKSISGPLSTCLAALNHLEGLLGSSLLTRRNSKWQALTEAVTWQFKDNEILEILNRIERCKSTLKLDIAAHEWYVVQCPWKVQIL